MNASSIKNFLDTANIYVEVILIAIFCFGWLCLFIAFRLSDIAEGKYQIKYSLAPPYHHRDEALRKAGATGLLIAFKVINPAWVWAYILGLLSFPLIIVRLILRFQYELVALMSNPIFLPIGILIGVGFYLLRGRAPFVYGLLEIAVGCVSLWFAIMSTSADANLLAKSFGIMGGIYILVRGLDNVDKGLPNDYRGRWDRIFHKDTSSEEVERPASEPH